MAKKEIVYTLKFKTESDLKNVEKDVEKLIDKQKIQQQFSLNYQKKLIRDKLKINKLNEETNNLLSKKNLTEEENIKLKKQLLKEQKKLNVDNDAELKTFKEITKVINKLDMSRLSADVKKYNSIEGNSLEIIRKKTNALVKYASKLDINSKEYANLKVKIKENVDLLKSEEKQQGNNTREVGNYAIGLDALKDRYSGLIGKLEQFGLTNDKISVSGGGLKGVFSIMKNGLISATRAGLAFIATPIGAAIAALVAIGAATKAWFDFNNEIVKTNKILSDITQKTGDEIDEIRIRSTTLNDVFGKDIEETTRTAKKLVQNFGISYEEAFNTIEEGLLKGGNANEEFLDSLDEFGVFFDKAGYSVDEFKNIVNSGYDLGIYKDKLPDALKEFDLAINEQTKASREALVNAFGNEFTDKLFGGISDGTISTKEALILLNEETEKTSLNNQQLAQLTADLFKGAGEDAGGYLNVLDAVNKGLNTQADDYNTLQQYQKDNLELTKKQNELMDEAFKSDTFVDFINVLKNGWTSFVNHIIQRIIGIEKIFQFLYDSIVYIFDEIKNAIKYALDIKFVKEFINKLTGYFNIANQKIEYMYNRIIKVLEKINILDTEQEKLNKNEQKRMKSLIDTYKSLDAAQKNQIKTQVAAVLKSEISLKKKNDAIAALIKTTEKLNDVENVDKKENDIDKEDDKDKDINNKILKSKKELYDNEIDLLNEKINQENILLNQQNIDLSKADSDEVLKYIDKLQEISELQKTALKKEYNNKVLSKSELAKLDDIELQNYEAKMIVEKQKLNNKLFNIDVNNTKKIAEVSSKVFETVEGKKIKQLFQYNKTQLDLLNKTSDEKLQIIKNQLDIELSIIEQKYNKEKELLDKNLKDKQISVDDYNNAILLLTKTFNDTKNEYQKEASDKSIQITNDTERTKQQLEKATFDIAKKLTQVWANIDEVNKNAEIKRAGDNKEKIDEINKKYSEKAKQRAIANILIDTAQSIMGIWAAYGELPYVAAALTAVVAGISATQIATVQSQPILAEGGLINGPLHATGGIQYNGAEVEGNEFIMNRASTQAYYPIIKTLNDAGNGSGNVESVKQIDIIDYEKLAGLINNKKVYVTTKDLNDSLDQDDKLKVKNTF